MKSFVCRRSCRGATVVRTLAALLLLAVMGAGLLWLYVGRTGSTELEQWVGRQIVGVLEGHLQPRIEFDRIDYQAPKTVVVDRLALLSSGERIMSIERIVLTLVEIPQHGQPIQIAAIEMSRPEFHFIVDRGDLIGWDHFVRQEVVEDPESLPEGRRLSDVLVLRHMAISDGRLTYVDRQRADAPMTLSGIHLNLAAAPADDEPGWYALKGTFQREPLLYANLDARIDLDNFVVDLVRLQVEASLDDQGYTSLPPEVQDFLRRHQVRGGLNLTVRANVPLNDLTAIRGEVQAELRDARAAYAGTVVPAKQIDVSVSFPDGPIHASVVNASLAFNEQPLFSASKVALEAAGFPKEGAPWTVDRLVVEQPHVTLARNKDGTWAGWQDLVPDSSGEKDSSGTIAALPVFIKDLRILEAGVHYQPSDGRAALRIQDVNVEARTTAVPDQPATIKFEASVGCEPGINARATGQLDLATSQLTLEHAQVEATIDAQNESAGWREVLRRLTAPYEIVGRVVANADGTIDIKQPSLDRINLHVEATQADVRGEDLRASAAQVKLHRPAGDAGMEVALTEARLHRANLTLSAKQLKLHMEPGDGGFALSADSAALEAADQTLASAEHLAVRLPSSFWTQPVVEVQQLDLQQPAIDLRRGPDGSWIGWSSLAAFAGEPKQGGDGKDKPNGESESPKGLALTKATIRGAKVQYQSSPNEPVIAWSDIDIDAKLDARPDQPIRVEASLVRKPLVQLRLAGQLDAGLSTFDAEVLTANANIREDQYDAWPAPVRDLFIEHRLKGNVEASFQGRLALQDPLASEGQARLTVQAGNVAYRGVMFPVQNLQAALTLPNGPAHITGKNIQALADKESLLTADRLTVKATKDKGASWWIDELSVQSPRLRLIAAPDGTYRGWDRLTQSPSTPAGASSGTDKDANASAPIPLGKLNVSAGELTYQHPGWTRPIVLAGIDGTLLTPKSPQPSAGQSFTLQVADVAGFKVSGQGRINVPQSTLELKRMAMTGNLAPAGYAKWPDDLAALLQQYQVTGQLDTQLTGRVNWKTVEQSDAQLQTQLTDARLTTGEYQLPIDQLTLQSRVARGTLQTTWTGKVLGGQTEGKAIIGLTAPRPLDIQWKATRLQLQRAQAQASLSGLLDSEGRFRARRDEWDTSVSGSGTVKIEKGRLINVPVIRALLNAVSRQQASDNKAVYENADVAFDFEPKAIRVKKADVTSPAFALNGSGRIFYDGRLDLYVKTDVFDRLLSQQTPEQPQAQPSQQTRRSPTVRRKTQTPGRSQDQSQRRSRTPQQEQKTSDIDLVLKLLGKTLSTYKVTGTLSEPKVTVSPFGRPK